MIEDMNFLDTEKCSAKDVLNAIRFPLVIAEAVQTDYGTRDFTKDFKLIFFNKACYEQLDNAILKCEYYHDVKKYLSFEVPWLDMADKAMNGIPFEAVTYFSSLSNAWFKVNMMKINESYVLISLDNVTVEKMQDKKLNEIAYIDVLTGLKSRSKFNEDITDVLAHANFSGTKVGFLLINLDNMKNINDYNGHFLGDKVLKKCAEILNRFSASAVDSYRYGGDEFIVVIKNGFTYDSIVNVCDTIFETFALEQISISGGVTIYPDDSQSCEDLLRFVDIAMHYAKRDGKNRVVFFKPDMQRIFVQKLNMQTKIASAVMKSDFYLMYQPQFDIRTGNLRGFEALIRWHDNDMGDIGPSIFIPMAEESGLILQIGEWVLKTAFSTLKKWQLQYNFEGILSVNISPVQIKQRNFIEIVKSLLDGYGINPSAVEIEITEGIMIDNISDAIEKMKELKRIGFKISLDDFGTGYSSLSYLQALPLDTLKIDKAFINGICAKDGVQANITNSIINMVTKMGLETIAEGVERPEQLAVLKDFDCHIVQGFLRGKPMPESNCDDYLNGNKSALISLENEVL